MSAGDPVAGGRFFLASMEVKGMPVSEESPAVGRRPMCLMLDADADELLRVMVARTRGFGRLVSELIRQEARKRGELPDLLVRLRAQQPQGKE
jgi:hypothetical protein